MEVIKKHEPNLFKAANKIFGKSYSYTRNYKRYAAFMKAFDFEKAKQRIEQEQVQMSLFDFIQ